MLDVHAVLHAAAQLLLSPAEPLHGVGTILDEVERRLADGQPEPGGPVPPASSPPTGRPPLALAALLDRHVLLGRTATPGCAGEIALTDAVLERVLAQSRPAGPALPVLAAAGRDVLRVERSRPGWHLNGTVRQAVWTPDAHQLAVFAIDEGDNDVLALVAVNTPGVQITAGAAPGSGRNVADLRFDDVTLPAVTPCPGEPAALADGLTVLSMADVIGASAWLTDRAHAEVTRHRAELQLGRAALDAAAAALTSPSPVRRQHDVSTAVLLVLPTCLRIAASAPDQGDPEVAKRVERVREQVLTLPAWHRHRLHALV